MVIIGSTAMKFWFPECREPKDIDIVGEIPLELIHSFPQDKKIEYLENPILEARYNRKIDYNHGCLDKYVPWYITPDDLYTLKISHVIGWDLNWEKHMYDIQFLKKKGCILNIDLCYQFYSFWNTIHNKNKRSDLEMTADEFFNNAVKSDYDHDYLHTLINSYPTFNKVLKDGEEVEVDQHKFNNLSFEDKCNLVTEEVMIMAFERFKDMDYRTAYSKMLKKFIINHAPIWEAIFIIENFVELHKPKFNFIKHINEQLKNERKRRS